MRVQSPTSLVFFLLRGRWLCLLSFCRVRFATLCWPGFGSRSARLFLARTGLAFRRARVFLVGFGGDLRLLLRRFHRRADQRKSAEPESSPSYVAGVGCLFQIGS